MLKPSLPCAQGWPIWYILYFYHTGPAAFCVFIYFDCETEEKYKCVLQLHTFLSSGVRGKAGGSCRSCTLLFHLVVVQPWSCEPKTANPKPHVWSAEGHCVPTAKPGKASRHSWQLPEITFYPTWFQTTIRSWKHLNYLCLRLFLILIKTL